MSLKIGHLKYVKDKIVSYELLISGDHAFRLMRFMNWIYGHLCLNDYEATIVQRDGPKGHMHIKFRDNGRMQDVVQSTGSTLNIDLPMAKYQLFG